MHIWNFGIVNRANPSYKLPYFSFSIERPLAITIKVHRYCFTFGYLSDAILRDR